MHASIWAAGSVVVLWFAGCGGTASNGTGSSPATYCEAEAAWRDRCKDQQCGTSTFVCPVDASCPPPQPSTCNVNNLTCDAPGAEACLARVFRPEALLQLRDCELALACNGDKEHCLEVVSLPNPLPEAAAFAAGCERKQRDCEGQYTGGDRNFFCFDLSAMTADYVAIYQQCLEGDCNSIRGCMDGGKFDAFCAM